MTDFLSDHDKSAIKRTFIKLLALEICYVIKRIVIDQLVERSTREYNGRLCCFTVNLSLFKRYLDRYLISESFLRLLTFFIFFTTLTFWKKLKSLIWLWLDFFHFLKYFFRYFDSIKGSNSPKLCQKCNVLIAVWN
jgi:hypothetical protein